MAILESVTPLVEQLSIDEAFLDVDGRPAPARHRAEIVAGMLRGTGARRRPGSSLSVGVATTKFLAKLASDLAKPDGLLVVEPGHRARVPRPLPGDPAVGRRPRDVPYSSTAWRCARSARSRRLARGGRSYRALGRVARRAPARAGAQRRPARGRARPGDEVDRRGGDVRHRPAHRRRVRARARAARRSRRRARLRAAGYAPRTVTLKIRFADFETRTRARTLPVATDVSTRRRSRRRASCSTRFDSGAACACSACRCRTSNTPREAQRRARCSTTKLVGRARASASSAAAVERVDRRSARPLRRRRGADPRRCSNRPERESRDQDRTGRLRPHRHGARLRDPAAHRRRARRRRAHRRPTTPTASAPRAWPSATTAARRPRRSTSSSTRSTSVWVCTWTAAHLEAVEAAADAGPRRCSARSRSAPTSPTASASRRCSSGCPHQVGLVLRWSPVFAQAAEIVACGEYGRPLATIVARRPVLPDPGPVRVDVAQGRRRTPAAAPSSSTRSTTSTCCAGCSATRSR